MAAHVDVDRVRAPAFALSDELRRVDSGEHAHRKHQLLFAARGALELSVAGGSYLLPPQRAALIRARVPHRVRTRGASLRTVYLAERVALPPDDVRVFAASPVLGEMIQHAMRWGPAAVHDAGAARFFAALIDVALDCARDPHVYRLPSAESEELSRAMELCRARLAAAPTLASIARAAGVSARTLERRFHEEAGVSFRSYLRTARVLRAMELLSKPRTRVTDAALAVGFESLSSFSRAFEAIAGERPREFVRRATSRRPAGTP